MRFAFLIVAEAEAEGQHPGDLWEKVADRVGFEEVCYVGNPCVVPDADEYATDSLHIAVNDGVIFTTHPTFLEDAEGGDEVAAAALREVGIEIPKDSPAECDACGGPVPGVLYPTFANGDGSRGWIERCDACRTFHTDEDAAQALVDAKVIFDFALGRPVGASSWVPFAINPAGEPVRPEPEDERVPDVYRVRAYALLEDEEGMTANQGPEIVSVSDESPVTALAEAGKVIVEWVEDPSNRPWADSACAFDVRVEAPRRGDR